MKYFLVGFAALFCSACMSKSEINNDHQQRMLKCEQYVGDAREKCLQGENVTIDDYEDELKKFKKKSGNADSDAEIDE